MLETLVGGILGGVVGALSTWLGLRLKRASETATLARALLVEIESLNKRDKSTLEGLVMPLLAHWKLNGSVENAELLSFVFSEDSAVRFPVYYSSLSEIGLLPSSASLPLMQYHNLRAGLLRAGQLLCGFQHDTETIKKLATQLEEAVSEMVDVKRSTITELHKIAGTGSSDLPIGDS